VDALQRVVTVFELLTSLTVRLLYTREIVRIILSIGIIGVERSKPPFRIVKSLRDKGFDPVVMILTSLKWSKHLDRF